MTCRDNTARCLLVAFGLLVSACGRQAADVGNTRSTAEMTHLSPSETLTARDTAAAGQQEGPHDTTAGTPQGAPARKGMPSRDVISAKVRSILVDSLGVDERDLKPETTLVGDLGAEAIDFLDIVFRLEKEFGIEIARNELFPDDVLTNPKYVRGGVINEAGLAELRRRLPFADLARFAKNQGVQGFREFPDIHTVDSLVCYVQSKL
jgi:acyl carrier protein